jgi:hypothetical protein
MAVLDDEVETAEYAIAIIMIRETKVSSIKIRFLKNLRKENNKKNKATNIRIVRKKNDVGF